MQGCDTKLQLKQPNLGCFSCWRDKEREHDKLRTILFFFFYSNLCKRQCIHSSNKLIRVCTL